jgi:hypothetical protein
MLHIYVLLFNIILDKGIISESWGKGILKPTGALVINSNSSEYFVNLLFKTAENIFIKMGKYITA